MFDCKLFLFCSLSKRSEQIKEASISSQNLDIGLKIVQNVVKNQKDSLPSSNGKLIGYQSIDINLLKNASKSNLSINPVNTQEVPQNHEIISEMVSSPLDGNIIDGQSILSSEIDEPENDNSYSDVPKREFRSQNGSVVHSKGKF